MEGIGRTRTQSKSVHRRLLLKIETAPRVSGARDAAGTSNWSATATSAQPAGRDQAAYSVGFQQGEMILNDLGNGLTAIAVISPVGEFSIRDIQQQTPLADRVYFRALSRGEALTPKEGRADDFRWHGDHRQILSKIEAFSRYVVMHVNEVRDRAGGVLRRSLLSFRALLACDAFGMSSRLQIE